jgi:hypothetical protein
MNEQRAQRLGPPRGGPAHAADGDVGAIVELLFRRLRIGCASGINMPWLSRVLTLALWSPACYLVRGGIHVHSCCSSSVARCHR